MRISKINLNRKQVLLLLINALLLIVFIIVSVFARNAVKDLYSQQCASRWENKEVSYAQVSAFISPEQKMQKEELLSVRSSLMETLSKDSYNESAGNTRVWIDAYSGECKADIRKDYNTLNVTAVGVGGDFFQFHPIPLLSGGYISDEDLNHDRIVVDENFAWAMFGSNDIIGMQVWMGNTIYVIAGVAAVDEDDLYKTAYGSTNRIYMSYDQLKSQQESLNITCYEAVLPNPISNYGYYALKKAFGMEEEEEQLGQDENPLNFDNVEVMENTKRYEAMPLIMSLKTLKFRSMRTNSIGYPYWENIARTAEEKQVVLLVIRVILLIFPCICLVLWLYGLWSRKTWTTKSIFMGIVEKIRVKQEEKREAKRLEEEEQSDCAPKDFAEDDSEDGDLEAEIYEEAEGILESEREINTEEDLYGEADEESTDDEDSEESNESELRTVTGEDMFSL